MPRSLPPCGAFTVLLIPAIALLLQPCHEEHQMKVFAFDLLPYGEHLDHLVEGTELPWPLSKKHFKADVAVQTYAEHLQAWELMDQLGFDGVGFNEHHTSPYGLMNSPICWPPRPLSERRTSSCSSTETCYRST